MPPPRYLALLCFLPGCAVPVEPVMPSGCADLAWEHLPVLIEFEQNEDVLHPRNGFLFDEVAAGLHARPWFLLRVEGHRDHCVPETDPNLDERRAEAVVDALETRGIRGRACSRSGSTTPGLA